MLAAAFSRFASDLRWSDIPAPAREAALWHLTDSIGVAIAGATPGEPSRDAAEALARRWHDASGTTVLGLKLRCRPDASALLNGALGQALEMDDKHGSSLARPGSTVIPAALAVAEAHDLPLSDLLTSIAVGYEVMIRLGFVAGERFLERGYHTSSLLGAFGSAATVGRLLGCTASRIADAIGIAGTMAAGIQEATRTGSTSKILHGGWGAHVGVLATDMAIAGITGPDSVFEGRYGFYQTHLAPIGGELDWETPLRGLGETWHLPDTGFKPYPCCQLLHAFIEAGKQLLPQIGPVEEITRIDCRLAEPGLTLVTGPAERKRAPQHPHEARFSLPFTVATVLLHGDVDLDSFRPQRLADPAIRALAARVHWADDPDSDYPLHCPARMDIEANGQTFRAHVPYHPGCPEAPLARAGILRKFERNTRWLLGDEAMVAAESLLAAPPETSVRALLIP
jgi:2-methylcitrate dehydratase PrpD